jgi:uridine nucleosidase
LADFVGVSTVHGNASIEKVTKNCLRVMRALNKTNIPVHAGQARPLTRQHFSAKNIHGESGLDGTTLLPELRPEDKTSGKKAVLAMAEAILAQPQGETMLVATGSMTNAALLVSLYPEVIEWLKGVVIMGGAVAVGNVTPVAEFNIWVPFPDNTRNPDFG